MGAALLPLIGLSKGGCAVGFISRCAAPCTNRLERVRSMTLAQPVARYPRNKARSAPLLRQPPIPQTDHREQGLLNLCASWLRRAPLHCPPIIGSCPRSQTSGTP